MQRKKVTKLRHKMKKSFIILILALPLFLNIQCNSSKKDSVRFSYIESMSNDISPVIYLILLMKLMDIRNIFQNYMERLY